MGLLGISLGVGNSARSGVRCWVPWVQMGLSMLRRSELFRISFRERDADDGTGTRRRRRARRRIRSTRSAVEARRAAALLRPAIATRLSTVTMITSWVELSLRVGTLFILHFSFSFSTTADDDALFTFYVHIPFMYLLAHAQPDIPVTTMMI